MELSREITLPAPAEEVWRSLANPTWLGEDAAIDLRVFWWSEPGEDATRVELELEPDGDETHLRVIESRPLAMLDLYGAEFVQTAPGPRQPELLAR